MRQIDQRDANTYVRMDALHEVAYAVLDQIATRAGVLMCKHCEENLRHHAGMRCLFDGTSTFETLSILKDYVDPWGRRFSIEDCVKIIAEVDRRDQERWQTT